MAREDSGRQLFKGVITVLLLIAVAAGGVAWYFYDGMDRLQNSVEYQRNNARSAVGKVFMVREYLSPSLRNYHSLVKEGEIEQPDEAMIADTFNRLNQVFLDLGLPERQFSVTPVSTEDKPLRGTGQIPSEVEATLRDAEYVVCNQVLERVNADFSKYATMSDLEFQLIDQRKLNVNNRAVRQNEARYELSFKLRWYTPDPNALGGSDGGSGGGARPSSGRPSS